MVVRAKTSATPHPIWVQGEYITNPPKRPSDGLERPEGHYINEGGYPGANCYEINFDTFCRATGAKDKNNKLIFENDVLLWETEEEFAYYILQDEETAIDIVTGEILQVQQLTKEDIKAIGNVIDYPDFIEGMQYHAENGLDIPYVPLLDVQLSMLPYMKLHCPKCNDTKLSCCYMAKCKRCGGFYNIGFATKIYREREKAK